MQLRRPTRPASFRMACGKLPSTHILVGKVSPNRHNLARARLARNCAAPGGAAIIRSAKGISIGSFSALWLSTPPV